jgi:hypothetical protein
MRLPQIKASIVWSFTRIFSYNPSPYCLLPSQGLLNMSQQCNPRITYTILFFIFIRMHMRFNTPAKISVLDSELALFRLKKDNTEERIEDGMTK